MVCVCVQSFCTQYNQNKNDITLGFATGAIVSLQKIIMKFDETLTWHVVYFIMIGNG